MRYVEGERRPWIPAGLWAAGTVALLCGAAVADEVILTNGRKLEGRVVRETIEWVTLRQPGGDVRLERSRIYEVRSSRHDPQAKAPAKGHDGGPKARVARRPTLEELFTQLRGNELGTWQRERPHRADEPRARKARYKAVDENGRATYLRERPASPEGVGRLYEKHRDTAGPYVFRENRVPLQLWKRLHWHAKEKAWKLVHPVAEAFEREERLVHTIVRRLCFLNDSSATLRCAQIVNVMDLRRRATGTEEARFELAELEAETAKAAGSEQEGRLLLRVFTLGLEIRHAMPLDKLALAERRRGVLERLSRALR